MIKSNFIFVALLLLFLMQNLNAATYYVDNNEGNDGKIGRTPLTAWKSISKVNSTGFKSGDTISFKCGGRFSDAILYPPIDYLTFNSYGIGARPIIDGQGIQRCIDLIKT